MKRILLCVAILFSLLPAGKIPLFAQERGMIQKTRMEKLSALLKMMSRQQYEEAAEECKSLIKEDPEFSVPYSKLVTIGSRAGRLDEIERYFEALSATNPRALYSLGRISQERKDLQRAAERQIECLKAVPEFLPAAAALAQVSSDLKQASSAEQFFHSHPDSAASAFGMGRLFLLQGKLDSAMQSMELALRLNPALLEAKQEKIAIYIGQGKSREALELFDDLLSMISRDADPERRFHLLQAKSGMKYDPRQTVADMTEALQLSNEFGLKLSVSEASYLSQIGIAYWRINDFSKALSFLHQALELSSAGNRGFQSRILGNIGLVYADLRELSKAAKYYNQAIDAARAMKPPDQSSLTNFLINLSNITAEIGPREQARALLEEAGNLLGSSRDAGMNYRLQAGWATYYARIGKYSESLKYIEDALQIARDLKDPAKQGHMILLMANCRLGLGDGKAALLAYADALSIGVETRIPEILWKAEYGLGRALQEQQPEEALKHYRQAIDVLENARGRQISAEDRTGFLENKTDVYGNAIRLLIALHRRNPASNYNAEAFHLSERARARALLDSMGETVVRLEHVMDEDLQLQLRKIQHRLAQAEEQLTRAAGERTVAEEVLQQRQAELLQVVEEYQAWKRQLRLRNPRLAELTLPEPLRLAQVQSLLRN